MASLNHLSTEYVHVPISSKDNSDLSEDVVQMAVIPRRTDPTDSDWYIAQWTSPGVAALLIGPSGVLTLTPGTYEVWVRLYDNPEVPVAQAGVLYVR